MIYLTDKFLFSVFKLINKVRIIIYLFLYNIDIRNKKRKFRYKYIQPIIRSSTSF